MTGNNLNLSLCFDKSKKFIICGELVKFHLKITSPEFQESEPKEFLERIGASVESIEITEEDNLLSASSASASIDSFKGKKMKSVESLSNLLQRTTVDTTTTRRISNSNGSHDSQQSMSSVTARRFNSLSVNKSIRSKPFWDPEEVAIFIPLEAFIDSECLSASCRKAVVKFRVSLNELVPIDNIEALRMGFNVMTMIEDDNISSAAQSSHKLERIGLVEASLSVLRPLEVSLKTHKISSNQVILQIVIEFNHENEGKDLNGNFEIETVELVLSDNSFTSKKRFKIQRISGEKQVPFVFETSPQEYFLLYNWTLCETEKFTENYHLRVELGGKIKSDKPEASDVENRELSDTKEVTDTHTDSSFSFVSLSFESIVPIFNLFSTSSPSGIKITSTKLIGNIKLFETFQVELILHNFDNEIKSLHLDIEEKQENVNTIDSAIDGAVCHAVNSAVCHATNNAADNATDTIKEWFHARVNPKGIIIMSPLTTLKVENIPSGGSKAIRLNLLPMKKGIFNLKNEFKIVNKLTGKNLKFDKIIIKVEG